MGRRSAAIALLLWAAPALAHRQAGLECLAPPFPPDGTTNVPTNVLVFDFAAPVLQTVVPIPTVPAPAPWTSTPVTAWRPRRSRPTRITS